MGETTIKKYPLDSSAVIHLASKRKGHTNSFRISVALTENVCPSTLQEAFNHITPHFPTIVAAIQRSTFQYQIVPVEKAPNIELDQECLAYMEDDKIETCAMRVLYAEKRIAVEIFHALTDGHGGLVFFRALLMEYYSLKNGISRRKNEEDLLRDIGVEERNLTDDYITYAGKKTASANHRKVYCIPGNEEKENKIHITTGIYDVQDILCTAHRFHTSLTTFLTTVMASSIIEMESIHEKEKEHKPIQIMVPANLRKKFQSTSIRNFSLYALPCVEISDFELPFEMLSENIGRQLQQQLSQEQLERMISTNVRLQNMRLIRCTPLCIKEIILRLCCCFFGERNSCLTLSNLGEITFPNEIQQYVERAEVMLSPRRNAPYNCGVASYDGKLYINFSRRGAKPELEFIFFRKLENLGCKGKLDGYCDN